MSQLVERLRRFSFAITPDHYEQTHAYRHYHSRVEIELLKSASAVVVDLGGGRHFQFDEARRIRPFRLISIDIDQAELDANASADERICADVCAPGLKLPNPADLVLSRAGFEHFQDNKAALANLAGMLRPGGKAIVVFAGRHAPFAVLNRLLPERMAQWALSMLIPGSTTECGFHAHYDRCTFSAFSECAENSGFDVVEYYPSFFSSGYFAFAPPLYVLSLALDVLRFAIGGRNLASYHFFVLARR
jgi:SAM-dependent methyltransferase